MSSDNFAPCLPAALLKAFREWVHLGPVAQVTEAMAQDTANAKPYRTLGEFVGAHSRLESGEEKISLREFLSRPANPLNESQGTVRDALSAFLTSLGPYLIGAAMDRLPRGQVDDQPVDNEQAASWLRDRFGHAQLGAMLMDALDHDLADAPVYELFRRRRQEFGFASWSVDSDEMLANAERRKAVGNGAVHLAQLLATDDDDPVVATEWASGLVSENTKVAVCSGTVYRFRLAESRSLRRTLLVQAADSVSSGDLDRVEWFLNSFEEPDEAEKVLAKGDIAFLWEWERRHGTTPGLGLQLLKETCSELRHAYPKLRTLVIAISAERFAPRARREPVLISEARAADLRKCRNYVMHVRDQLGLDVNLTESEHNDVAR
jgi:hypothetical protein